MINSKQQAIIKKDLLNIFSNKRLLLPTLLVPFVFTIFIPSVFILSISLTSIEFTSENISSDIQQLLTIFNIDLNSSNIIETLINIMFNSIFPIFFMIIPIMASSILAASSFVGEKEKSTLETLLYSPLTLKQIFVSKVFASFSFSMIISFMSFLILIVVTEAETFYTTKQFLSLSWNWPITLFILNPSISLLSITLIVKSSAKAQTVEESQQKSALLVLPIMLLIIGQVSGLFLINSWLLLFIGIVVSIIAFISLKRSMKNFSYEHLLT